MLRAQNLCSMHPKHDSRHYRFCSWQASAFTSDMAKLPGALGSKEAQRVHTGAPGGLGLLRAALGARRHHQARPRERKAAGVACAGLRCAVWLLQ